MKLRIWGLLATAAFAAPCIHSKREAAMKTLSIVAITAFAFLGLANFASAQRLQVSSTTFMNNQLLPIRVIDDDPGYTTPGGPIGNLCAPKPSDRGGKQSPALSWTNVPPGTNSFVVTAFDDTAQVFHWGMYDIPKDTTSLPENASAAETIGLQVKNYSGALGYIGPCPPPNDPRGDPHKYTFRVFALRQQKLDLPLNSDSAALSDALNAAIPLDTRSISGLWSSTP
jgi:Raf kinase inhibitor-like YbhB/YbcL family protein